MMNEKKFLKALQWPAGAFILVFWIPLLFSQQPVRKPVKKPVQKPVQQPVQQPVQPPAQQTVQQPVQKTVQKKAVEKKLEIQSFDRKELSLKAGGDAAIIIVNGRNLDLVKSVRVVLNGNPVDEIKASLDRAWPSVKKVRIQAGSQAKVLEACAIQFLDSKNGVLFTSKPEQFKIKVSLLAKTTEMKLDQSKLNVQAKSGLSGTTVSQPTGLPYIASWTRSPGHINTEIKFLGRDLVPEYFKARIGTQSLNITSSSATEIRAVSSQRLSGDLIVGYGTPGTEYVLEAGYRVCGDPVIQSVSPSTFTLGDVITITGIDLDGSYIYQHTLDTDPVAYGYIKISDQSTSSQGSDFVRVEPVQQSADGKTCTYKVYDAYSHTYGQITKLSPQPSALTGRLRLCTGSSWFSVVSPGPVTYKGFAEELEVTKVFWSLWPEVTTFIIQDQDEDKNIMKVEGRGLLPYKTTTKLGNVSCLNSFSADGRSGWMNVTLGATSGPIVFTRDNLQVQSNFVNVIPPPKFTPNTMTVLDKRPVEIVLNTRYQLQGWNLQAGGVPGLSYEFLMPTSCTTVSYLKYNLYAHTASLIEFSVDQVGDLPQNYQSLTIFGGTPGTYSVMQLKAKYGTKEKVLFSNGVILKVQ